ncbi:MAG: hypothetical protein WDO73_36860 [Ignavibacteriota bacterium]
MQRLILIGEQVQDLDVLGLPAEGGFEEFAAAGMIAGVGRDTARLERTVKSAGARARAWVRKRSAGSNWAASARTMPVARLRLRSLLPAADRVAARASAAAFSPAR